MIAYYACRCWVSYLNTIYAISDSTADRPFSAFAPQAIALQELARQVSVSNIV
ncbi:hypothetical protein [Nostoc sp.]